jgi:sugar phosphate isomerase/epimerase
MRVGFITNLSEEDFRFARDNDIPCVEYNCGPKDTAVVEQMRRLQILCARYGVDFSMIGLYGREFLSKDAKERQGHLDDAKRLIDFCCEIGSPLLVTGAGLGGERESLKTKCKKAVASLGELIEYGQPIGIRVALYNCHWTNFAYAPDAWDTILGQLPDLGIKYDPSHTFYDGRDYLAELRDWGQRVYHAHAKGGLVIGGERFEDPPAGLDQILWGPVVAVLVHHGYEGDINIEPHSRTWLGERRHAGILLARRHLQQFLP